MDSLFPTSVVALLILSLPSTIVQSNTCQRKQEGQICSINGGRVCKNQSCISACEARGMFQCQCDQEEDNYCYLCCGNERTRCLPAHVHNILTPTGQFWERKSCEYCRDSKGYDLDGLPCDDKDGSRLCMQGKCTDSICHDKLQGAFCDKKEEKICVDNECLNPCAKLKSHLMVCECPKIDPDTGFATNNRCQLCCYDYQANLPTNRRCQNAHRHFGIVNKDRRPIWRVGLSCAGGRSCNRFGVCDGHRLSIDQWILVLCFAWTIVSR